MTVKVTKTIDISPNKLREFLISSYATKHGIDPSKIKVHFQASMDYGYHERDPGTPVFIGVSITIDDVEDLDF